jgi:FtsP/CotA-like multicopper oxidase with cupredoxin domain
LVNNSRRSFFRGIATIAGMAAAGRTAAGQMTHPPAPPRPGRVPGAAAAHVAGAVVPVVTPDIPHLPFEIEGGVKVFKLRAEPVKTEFVPGRPVDAWGFNGSVPGPTIEVNEGDRVRIIVENRLPEMFAPHWHGLEVPIEMDGVPGISQPPIKPGESYTYEFTLHQNGTFFYHSHMPMQEMMGMIGLLIVHPATPHAPRVDRDFGLILQGWAILPNNTIPNTLAMEFNWLTFNGKSGPATTPIVVKRGERVRIRLVNLSMDHHPVHLHGHQFHVTGTEAGRGTGPFTLAENTVIVGVAQARDIEFDAKYVGDWMLHCHLPHHMMNQMVSMVGPMMVPAKGAPMPGHEGHVMAGQDASKVPGFPQDMWMPMDELAGSKPELLGLPEQWTGAMMGMMTLVRVVDPVLFDRIERLRAGAAKLTTESAR